MNPAVSEGGAADVVAAIAKVAAGIGWLEKTGENTSLRYSFLEESKVVAEFAHPLAKAGIIVLPEVLEDSFQEIGETKYGTIMWLTRLKVAFTFTDGDQWVRVVTVGYGTDTGDKGGNKAMTAAKKYAMMIVAAIAQGSDPEEAREDEKEGAERSGARRRGSRRTSRSKASEDVDDAEEEKPARTGRRRRSSAVEDEEGDDEATQPQRNRMFAMAKKVDLDQDELRALVLNTTGKHSSKQLTRGDMDKVYAALEDASALAEAKGISERKAQQLLDAAEEADNA